MDIKLWHSMLNEAIYWQDIDYNHALDIFHRTAVAYGSESQYYMQGPDIVDLTKLYEQFKIVSLMKGTYHVETE